MVSLGVGFFPSNIKNPYLYFDRQKFLTLGNGDPLYKGEIKIREKDDRPLYSEFLAILQTLIFYTEQSESNLVIMVTLKSREYTQLLAELFPDYEFYFFSPDYDPDMSSNNLNYAHHLKREDFLNLSPIIFCENIILTEWMDMKPYLVMGTFEMLEDLEFYDGIVIRPIYGDNVRLLVKGVSYRVWNMKNMEKTLLHHLMIVREKYRFFDPIDGEKGKDCHYDSTAEKYLKNQYLRKVNLPSNMENIDKLNELFSPFFF